MGFLKRFFSLGRTKGKKTKASHIDFNPPSITQVRQRRFEQDQDQEAAVSRLLRSSSAHFAVVAEVDYASLPPIPHPINTISRTPTTSPIRSPSIQTKSSYVVTIHGRTHHSHTEFPNANPSLLDVPSTRARNDRHEFYDSPPRRHVSNPRKVPITPRDQNRLNRLRQDPSVVSLLNMYDDHGRLDDRAFSNTPPSSTLDSSDGKPQKQRRESTFRELLGDLDGGDGDISWAEGHLAASNRSTSSISTTSSLGLETPTDVVFTPVELSSDITPKNVGISADASINSSSTCSYPLISSLEVELSTVIDAGEISFLDPNPKFSNAISRTPSQRASQVFRFLSEKRPKVSRDGDEPKDRPLPSLPLSSRTSTSTGSEASMPTTPSPDFLHGFSYSTIDFQATSLPAHELVALDLPAPPSPFVFQPLKPAPRTKSRSTSAIDVLQRAPRDTPMEKLISLDIPAATNHPYGIDGRIPRGPRPLTSSSNVPGTRGRYLSHGPQHIINTSRSQVRAPSVSLKFDVTTDTDKADGTDSVLTRNPVSSSKPRLTPASGDSDHFTPLPPRLAHRRASSTANDAQIHGLNSNDAHPKQALGIRSNHIHPSHNGTRAASVAANVDKENTNMLVSSTGFTSNRKADPRLQKAAQPITPIKMSLAPTSYNMRHMPSPNSSSELSPEGQRIMSIVRSQKMRAREREARAQRRSTALRLRA